MAERLARRRWIKLWTQETLFGSICKELAPDERSVWFQLLCAAGDSIAPRKIGINENIPYTDEQLVGIFDISLELLHRTLTKLESEAMKRIKRNGNGIIEILDWEHYQDNERHQYMAEYMRNYRGFGKQDGYSIPPYLRVEVLERDEYQCVQCGSDGFLQIDHIIPFQDGGKTQKDNLQTLCRGCNNGKKVLDGKIRQSKTQSEKQKE